MKRFFLSLVLCTAAFLVCCTEDEPILFGDIYGTVTDSQTGEPIRNAEVVLSPKGASTISGSDGHFEFRSLDAGQYSISVSSDGYESNSRQVTVVPGQSTSCDIHLTPKAVVEIFNIDPLTLNFGTTQTQLAVTVTNDSPNDTQWSLDLGQNTWLKASPIAGQIGAGKKQTIVFSANRANLTQETSGIVTLSALGGSSSLTVNCSPSQQASSIMEVTPLDIDFGDNSTEQIVRIKNKSNALLNWTIFGIKEDAISVSDTSGSIQSGNAKVVAVKLDRSKIEGNHLTTSFMISDGTVEQQINVNVGSHESSTSDNPDEPIDEPMGKLELPSSVLDFGTDYGRLPMTINNVGDAMLEWSIVDVQDDIFSFSPESGTLEAGNSAEIQVSIDRENLPAGTAESVFAISDGINKYVVTVKYEEPEYTDGKIQLSTNTVDFGSEETLLFFEVKNVGTTYLSWTASDIPEYITFNYGYLTCKQGQNSTMNNRVELNRETMPDEVDVVITITNDFNSEDTHQVRITASKENTTTTANSKIYYTSTDGNVVTPYKASAFGANIVSNVYENGQGIITFDGKITSIGDDAFKQCNTLATITIPDGTISIGNRIFEYCSNLTSIKIPEDIVSIGDSAFYECYKLSSIILPNSVTSIGSYAFYRCERLISIIIPDGVTSIQTGTFNGCTKLSSINIPNRVTSIGFGAFSGCRLLTNITIPNGVTIIETDTFSGCEALSSINIPEGVTSIGESAFSGCESLTSITIPENVKSIGSSAFSGCESLTSINIPNGVTTLEYHVFSNCANITSIDIPNSVTTIGHGAFYQCSKLENIIIPENVTSIGESAFYFCTALSSIAIPDKVSRIESDTFHGCKGLETIILPSSIIEIKGYAFSNCTALTSITIPENVTDFGHYVFSGDTKLSSVYCKPTTPPYLDNTYETMFQSCPANLKIYVPTASVDTYKAASSDWNVYADKIVGYDFE